MSLIQSMRDVGRPLAYYPRLSRFFGSVNASIFFSQLAYWQDRTDNPMGVYKTAEEWEDETGLSYREQVTARKHLTEQSFLVETHKRLEHRVYYRLDFDAIDAAFGEWTKRHFPNCAFRSSPNDENAVRGMRFPQSVSKTETTSETTAETTNKKTPAKPARFDPLTIDLPAAVSSQAWGDWIAYRKTRKLSTTEQTAKAQLAKLTEWAAQGHKPAQIIADSIANGWQGLFEPKAGKARASKIVTDLSTMNYDRAPDDFSF